MNLGLIKKNQSQTIICFFFSEKAVQVQLFYLAKRGDHQRNNISFIIVRVGQGSENKAISGEKTLTWFQLPTDRQRKFQSRESVTKQGRIHGHTSCGRVGRGGNTRFHTFQLVLTNGPTDRPTDRRKDGQTKALIELRVRN